MTTLLLLEACCLVGCDSGTTVTTDTDTPPGCESGQCPIDGENATFFDPEIGAHTHATDDCPDCFRRRPPESGTPQPTPPFKFDFPGDEKPAPETKPVPPPTQKEGPNVDLIIALVSTVLGMAGAYAASRLDDNPDNDFSITDLAKDVAAKIAKARL